MIEHLYGFSGCTSAASLDAMVLESRREPQDTLDMKMLNYLRTQQIVSKIRMHHKTGPSDPMLWVPDACCGAIVDYRRGVPEFYSYIEEKLPFIRFRKRTTRAPSSGGMSRVLLLRNTYAVEL